MSQPATAIQDYRPAENVLSGVVIVRTVFVKGFVYKLGAAISADQIGDSHFQLLLAAGAIDLVEPAAA